MSTFTPDFYAEGTGARPSPVAPDIETISLVGGVILVAASPASISGPFQVVQLRLYRGPGMEGPWTGFPAQNLSALSVQTLLFDWNPAYGVQQFYAISAIDVDGNEGGLSSPVAYAASWNQATQENLPFGSVPALATDYGLTEPEDLLTDQFPEVPFNFLTPPPGMVIGPLHLLVQKCALAILEYRSRVLLLLEAISVQTAQGAALDAHAPLYGTYRFSNEIDNDEIFRARLLALAQAGRGRLSDIKTAVQNHYDDLATQAGVPSPIVNVFDLRSNPPQALTDGLKILDFEVSVTFVYRAANAWFLNNAFLGVSSYLAAQAPVFVPTLGPDFDAIMTRTKAANTNAVYKIQAVYD